MGGFARRAAAVAIAALALTACGKSATQRAAATKLPQPTVPATAPTTVPTDPYAVPATIDAAYLNKVFAALDHVSGDATRLIVASKQLVPPAAARLAAIYDEQHFKFQTNNWVDLLTSGQLGRSKTNPGDRTTSVERILQAGPACVYVAARRDYSAITVASAAPRIEYVGLKPLDQSRDPSHFNPTPWMIVGEGFNPDGTQPASPC